MLAWVGGVQVNDLGRAAAALGVPPESLLRALLCTLHYGKDIDPDSLA